MSIHQYWIAYDLSDDRERARVERCLLRYGQRLQKSVFHCVLDRQRLSRLEGELRALGCGSGAIAVAVLAEPARVLGTAGPDVILAENWAFTCFPGMREGASLSDCVTSVQSRAQDLL
ncbi:CRISPR-associated endonuclease Cas2 [Thermomonas flagellata]|uniref:CRISPR-associated endonuclease Cas2 n=1 Tax=Thermomonas flagellata TaxID=2888524 RepID=UPI001F0486ED|nr:CRISPR-associated endonuclease Cas2 [Thermomonas flagellata]